MNIAYALKYAAGILGDAGITDARRESSSLLMIALSKDRTFLIAHPEYELTATEQEIFERYAERRSAREPLQYIRGTQEFYGLDFEVAPGVLIPRPETEMLVENALNLLKERDASTFCEIGIGTGCISIAILHEAGTARATGLEISAEAIAIATRNAARHDVSNRFEIRESDVYAALNAETFDLIVSNPPYISLSEYENLQPEVLKFEPAGALTDGGSGLSIIERIINGSPKHLEPGAFLLMEIGFGQADAVTKMFDREVWASIEIIPDLQSIPRMAYARLKA